MQATIQPQVSQQLSLRLAVTAVLLTSAVVALSFAVLSGAPTSDEMVESATSTPAQLISSGLSTREGPSVDGDAAVVSVRLWPSETMDSHESIQSLAAIGKTTVSNAKPLRNASVSAEATLAWLEPAAPTSSR